MNLFGRKTLYYTGELNTLDDVVNALNNVYVDHTLNITEIEYLWNYYLGKQDVMDREKTVRADILKNTVVNHANQIVSFFKAYGFGEGAQYIKRGEIPLIDNTDVTNDVAQLNNGMSFKDKKSSDQELATWLLATGVGYRSIFPDSTDLDDVEELPIEFSVLDPRQTGILYSTDIKPKPKLAFTYTRHIIDDIEYYTVHVYTEEHYYKFRAETSDSQWLVSPVQLDYQRLYLNKRLPIIEYNPNVEKQGVFEPVIPLLNMINEVTSNRGEAVEQFVQAYWKFINADVSNEDVAKFVKSGIIAIKNSPDSKHETNVELITSELDQDGVQAFVDDLTLRMLQIAGVPDRRNSTSGSTGAANMTANGWYDTDAKVGALETMFIKSEKQFIRIALYYIKTLGTKYDFSKTNLADIDIRFSRNKTDNLLVKTQALQTLLSSGISPRIAIATVGLFSDPESVYEDSKETIEKSLVNKNNPTNSTAESLNTGSEEEL